MNKKKNINDMGNLIATIDCDADATGVIDGFKVYQHIKMGRVEFDPSKALLYQSERQRSWIGMSIADVIEELRGKKVYNEQMFRHIWKHREELPDEWRKNGGNKIHFLGTTYHNSIGSICVLTMEWRVWEVFGSLDGNWTYYMTTIGNDPTIQDGYNMHNDEYVPVEA